MFSEYASRFLAQSQSRLLNTGQGDKSDQLSAPTTSDWPSRNSRLGNRSSVSRGTAKPYQSSASRFGSLAAFGSWYPPQDAPLFQTPATQNEEDEEERDREAADLFVLQRSRRVFAAGRLEESTENEDEGSHASLDQSRGSGSDTLKDGALGIRSSWRGKSVSQRMSENATPVQVESRRKGGPGAVVNESGDTKGLCQSPGSDSSRLEEVVLESTITIFEAPAGLATEAPLDQSAQPAFQTFQAPSGPSHLSDFKDVSRMMWPTSGRRMSIADTILSAAPAVSSPPEGKIFKHDPWFAWLFLVSWAALVSSFVLVWLHTSTNGRLGDTIYTTLRASQHMLAVDTLVAVMVSLVWLAALRSVARYLVALIVIAVPIIMFSFSIYPYTSSFRGRSDQPAFQARAMRWAAVIPAVAGVLWIYTVYHVRHALGSAIKIIEFASRILAANSALVWVGVGCLVTIVVWTWVWMAMFARVFLGGYFSTSLSKFIISASSWWLGIFFVLTYLWTIAIISGIQRGTAAATVSQWYFHRNVLPAPPSRDVMASALQHSATTIFGTISLSTLLALAIRLPLLVLPRRAANLLSFLTRSCVPSPIVALINPLTITYAGIHSHSLSASARGLSQMEFVSSSQPTTTLTPQAVSSRRGRNSPWLPYRLAKLILHATRVIMATALGSAGWVMTARQLSMNPPGGAGARGSAYAYVVGLVASFIGWGVLGAVEGVLGGIVDALVVCYGSEKRMAMRGAGYCMEAAVLFGDREPGRDEEDEL